MSIDFEAEDTEEKTEIKPSVRPRDAANPHTACLIVISGKAVGKMYKLVAPEMVIGRSSDCQIQLEDDGVSRRHAKVSLSPDGVIRLIDLASTAIRN